ncbi:MAG: lycopene beta-cyclase CrtY [Planctomycetota bacterium]
MLNSDFDYVIVGGGLQGCLLLAALAHYQSDARVLLVEPQDVLCGNHTWSFHQSDLDASASRWFSSLVNHRWDHYRVRFDGLSKAVPISYGSILSDRLANRTEATIKRADNFERLQQNAVEVFDDQVLLEDGRRITGRAVLDCRGIDRKSIPTGCGYQKFLGLEVELMDDWDSPVPCLMDCCVEQSDGFRFFYTLPFSKRVVLIEETRFSNSAELNCEEFELAIQQYLAERGFEKFHVRRRESGVLPMPYQRSQKNGALALGYRGGYFHAATGYSIPLAANIADALARVSASEAINVTEKFLKKHRFQATFSLWLNRMLFQLIRPEKRVGIFKRFYRQMPTGLIRRFYGHQFSGADAVRMIVGRPPSGLTPLRFLNSFWEKPCPNFRT